MPKDAFGDIILFGGLAVGGYFLWQWWSGQTAATPAATTPATTTPAAPATPSYVYTPPSATNQLIAAGATDTFIKQQGGQGDAYQWATIYNGISGLPSISSVNINSTFYPNGLPANQTALANTAGYSGQGLPLITAAQFIQAMTAAGVKGLSGLGQTQRLITVPIMFTPGVRSTMQVPAGTTPAELQRRLRVRG